MPYLFILSSLKKKEKGDGIVIRCYNGTYTTQQTKINCEGYIGRESSMDEMILDSVSLEKFSLVSNEIKTLILEKEG